MKTDVVDQSEDSDYYSLRSTSRVFWNVLASINEGDVTLPENVLRSLCAADGELRRQETVASKSNAVFGVAHA